MTDCAQIPYWALYKDQHQLSIVSGAEAEAARPLETKLWARNAETPYSGEAPWWSCLHCIQREDETVEALRRHWLDELSISSRDALIFSLILPPLCSHRMECDIEEGIHYHRSMRAPPYHRQEVFLVNRHVQLADLDKDMQKRMREGSAFFFDF